MKSCKRLSLISIAVAFSWLASGCASYSPKREPATFVVMDELPAIELKSEVVMSEADRFLFLGRGVNNPFPFCLTDEVPTGYDYVGGLSLADICEIWWSLESISIASSGEFTEPADVGSDLNGSGDFPDGGYGFSTALNSLTDDTSTLRQPNERVCVESYYLVGWGYDGMDGFGNNTFFRLEIAIGIDPDDAAEFAVFYRIELQSIATSGNGCLITNSANASELGISGAPESSGTVDFNGISLDWIGGPANDIGVPGSAWTTGGTGFAFSVTPSFFTYPAP